ncbi:PREDICTED: uncharacterized protein LOC104783403 [Camelina sativa]|uniref:Uncharacterized protein LOC104783402 n=1 Tax=Camelina sativa TaxID=90675 RepID=A0ABM0YWF6_CAMSA|nr:PREDICTED: uncharacterized protein LOC104783402 [Camelina sativa]XP_010506865.1 PREDICTED: uncharacterized protein LOC104783403 [Camelina sativa]
MEFVTGLPMSKLKHDVVWVVVDRLTKSAQFIAIAETDGVEVIAVRYIEEIVRLHRVPCCMAEHVERRCAGRRLRNEMAKKLKFLKINLKEAQNRQKSYGDKSRKELEFEVGDLVYLKAMTYKGKGRFTKRKKLSPSEEDEVVEDVPPELRENLTVEATPIRIIDCMVKGMRRKKINMVKILWNCGGHE